MPIEAKSLLEITIYLILKGQVMFFFTLQPNTRGSSVLHFKPVAFDYFF